MARVVGFFRSRNTITKGVMYFTKGDYVAAAQKTWWNTYGESQKSVVNE